MSKGTGNSSEGQKSRVQTKIVMETDKCSSPTRTARAKLAGNWTQTWERQNSGAETTDCPQDHMLLLSSHLGYTNPQ